MSLMDSVMQTSDKINIDLQQSIIDKINIKKIHWWNIPQTIKHLIVSTLIYHYRITLLETQIGLQTEALNGMLQALALQQKQIQILSEGRKNE